MVPGSKPAPALATPAPDRRRFVILCAYCVVRLCPSRFWAWQGITPGPGALCELSATPMHKNHVVLGHVALICFVQVFDTLVSTTNDCVLREYDRDCNDVLVSE